jgi:ribosomal protein L37E
MSSNVSENNYLCPVCFDKATTSLECAHMICHDCLRKMVQTRTRKCPLCRYPIRFTLRNIDQHISLLFQK